MPGIDQQRHAGAGLRDRCIDLLRLPVPSAPLNVAMKKMIRHRIQHGLGRLRTRGIVEEDEPVLKCRKRCADLIDRVTILLSSGTSGGVLAHSRIWLTRPPPNLRIKSSSNDR